MCVAHVTFDISVHRTLHIVHVMTHSMRALVHCKPYTIV